MSYLGQKSTCEDFLETKLTFFKHYTGRTSHRLFLIADNGTPSSNCHRKNRCEFDEIYQIR